MDPKQFGPFLAQARREKGLTQAQLAKRLKVTSGAVSKWERCLCLPDVGKLADIAQALDLNILEVLKSERLPEEKAGREEQVYSATLETAGRQNRRKIRRWALGLAMAGLAVCFFWHHPVWHIAQVWEPSYFETGEVSQLAYIGRREDRQTARRVLDRAEEAFSSVGLTDGEAKERFGLLSRYTTGHPDAVSERHSLRLWSARFYGGDGTMWVYYTKEGLDKDGKVVQGSWRIPALWRLERNAAGEWEVTHIKEHP